MSCFLDGWLKTEKSVHWLIHVRSHRSSISCHFHCATNFSISDSLVLGLQIVHSSNFEYKLAFSSTKSNFSLTFSSLPQFTYFAPPHFVLFSLHHHHHLISIVFPPPSPLNFCCILSGTPTNNTSIVLPKAAQPPMCNFLHPRPPPLHFYLLYQHQHQQHISIVFPAPPPPGTHSIVFPKPPPPICILLHSLPPPATTTTVLVFSPHHHHHHHRHQQHTSIVFPLPPPPHLYFPSTTPTRNTRQLFP